MHRVYRALQHQRHLQGPDVPGPDVPGPDVLGPDVPGTSGRRAWYRAPEPLAPLLNLMDCDPGAPWVLALQVPLVRGDRNG